MINRRRAHATVLALVVLVTAGAGTSCITDRIIVEDHSGRAIAEPAQLRRVEQETAKLRHLPFLKPVPADVMTVDEVKAWFDRYVDVRKAELAKDDRFLHRAGILRPTMSTADAYKGFIGDLVGGVYDDGSERMILVSDYAWWAKAQQDVVGAITGVDWAYELFLAHELDHALQDQHLHLGEMLRGGAYEDNDDAAFVRRTILESEANVVGMAHFLGMDLDQVATRKAFFLFLRYNQLLNGPLLLALAGRTPSFFAKQNISVYELGLTFVERKLDEGGMNELSRAYVRRAGTKGGVPESTEQLLWSRKMHPETLDRPVPIARLEAPPASLPGSSLVATNVFGALAFRHFLEGLRGPLEATAVADGWGGDRWDLIEDPAGDPARAGDVLVWRTTWDSDDDARQFFDVWTAGVPTRYGPRARRDDDGAADAPRARFTIPSAPDEERFIRTTRDEQVHIERRGRDVLVIEGARPDVMAPLVDESWGLLVRAPEPAVDEALLAERARTLEQHMAAAPPSPPRPDLLGRLFLPARTMAFRMGAGIAIDADALDPARAVFPAADAELRWGFRPHLELSLPLSLGGEVRSPLGQTIARVELGALFPSPGFSLSAGHAVAVGERLVLAGQAALDDEYGDTPHSLRLAAGALAQPLEQVVIAPAIARIDDVTPESTILLGGVLQRGAARQPLFEVEVVDGLFVYESSIFVLVERPAGLALRAHSHVLGLLLYF